MKPTDIASRIDSITRTLNKAEAGLIESWHDPTLDSSDYYVELAFFELLLLAETLNLGMLHSRLASMYEEAKVGFGAGGMGPEGPFLTWGDKLRMVLYSIKSMMGGTTVEPGTAVLSQFLHESLYSITDKKCFRFPPRREEDVHNRIELALRCAYTDMKRKPSISKPIKNFEPDTGILTLRTLIEYKFVGSDNDSKRVADEILADTRAYEDPAWSQFIFVIYETKRFRSPREWEELLRRCGTADKADVIVLCGEEPARQRRKGHDVRQRQSSGREGPHNTGLNRTDTALSRSPRRLGPQRSAARVIGK